MSTKLHLSADIFHLFNSEWALLTAGPLGDCNAMTISWGQLGTLWGGPGVGKNIATVFVKPIRHTFLYMEKHDIFTICWFPKEFRKDLGILGAKSGRDGDKFALTSLNPQEFDGGVSFKEAKLTLLCRKIYSEQLKRDRIPSDAIANFYTDEEPHYMYIGEVLRVEGAD